MGVEGMSISNQSVFSAIGGEWLQTVDAALVELRSIAEAEAARPLAPGKWSPKQVLGHLIDSAANNHQRFVRAQQTPVVHLEHHLAQVRAAWKSPDRDN
jgi:hypothetical protein